MVSTSPSSQNKTDDNIGSHLGELVNQDPANGSQVDERAEANLKEQEVLLVSSGRSSLWLHALVLPSLPLALLNQGSLSPLVNLPQCSADVR